MKLVSVKGCLTASAINLAYRMIDHGSTESCFYGVKVCGRGRYSNNSFTDEWNAKELLRLLNVPFTTGNDAPRGGKTGNFIRFNTKAFERALINFQVTGA